MAKSNGLGMTVSLDDSSGNPEAIGNDFTNLTFAMPRGVQDVTGVDKSAMERLLLLADASATFNGVFDPAVSPSAHDVFKTIPSSSASRTCTLVVQAKTWTAELFLTDYPLNRNANGEFTFAVPGVLTGGTAPAWT